MFLFPENMVLLVKYLQGEVIKGIEMEHLSTYLQWHDVPTPGQIAKLIVEGILCLS